MRRAIRTSHDLQPPGYRCRSISMTNDPSTQRYLGTLYSNGYFNDDTEGLRWLLVVVLRALCRLAAELAIILGVVSIIDQSRRTHDLQDMWSSAFIAPMAVLIAVALVSLLLSLKALRSKRPHMPINYLAVFFDVAALGAGTLTWASTTRRQCSADTCLCQKTEQRSVTDPGH
jgi:hypothetical protein